MRRSMRNREHGSFRREATFHAAPHALEVAVLEADHEGGCRREGACRREEVATGVSLLHGMMSRKECRTLIAAAEAIGFTHAGLAIGDDTYRVNLAVRNNLRVVFDSKELAAGLWSRVKGLVNSHHLGAPVVGLNDRFRVYRYETGMRFFPHVDVRTQVPGGETRESLVIFLNDEFEGGTTRFFETKDKANRRGEGRGRKFDNRVRFALKPGVGGAVVFDHLLLHEGAEVTAGIKYAVRSDVVYARP